MTRYICITLNPALEKVSEPHPGGFVWLQTGYLIGSIEGRVAVQHIEESMNSKNFTFKCHREEADIYAVSTLLIAHLCAIVHTQVQLNTFKLD